MQFSLLFETRPKATGFQDGKVLVVSPVGEVSTAGLWFLINRRRPPQGVNYPCLHNRKHLQPTSCGPEHSTSNIHCFYQLAHFAPKISLRFLSRSHILWFSSVLYDNGHVVWPVNMTFSLPKSSNSVNPGNAAEYEEMIRTII